MRIIQLYEQRRSFRSIGIAIYARRGISERALFFVFPGWETSEREVRVCC